MDPVLGAVDALMLQLVFEEPVTKRGVVLVKVVKDVDDLRVETVR